MKDRIHPFRIAGSSYAVVTADWLPVGAITVRVLKELQHRIGGKLSYGPKGYELRVSVRDLKKFSGAPQQALLNLIRDIGPMNPKLSP